MARLSVLPPLRLQWNAIRPTGAESAYRTGISSSDCPVESELLADLERSYPRMGLLTATTTSGSEGSFARPVRRQVQVDQRYLPGSGGRSLRSLTIALLALALGIVVSVPSAWGQLPKTQLTSVFPPGGKAGSTVDVAVAGSDIERLSQLVFSHPGIKATAKMGAASEFEPAQPINGQFVVEIAADVPVGTYEARVVGHFGVSNPRAFAVGRYNEITDGGNNSVAQAKPLELDVTVNGRIDAAQRDYYKLTLKSQQRVLVTCQAATIDSRLAGALTVLDPSGNELSRSVSYRYGDAMVDFTAFQDGDYIISLADSLYRGGADYFYRLTVDQGPFVDYVFPPSGVPGTTGKYAVYGRRLPDGKPTSFEVDGVPLERVDVELTIPASEQGDRLDQAGLVAPVSSLLDAFSYTFPGARPQMIYFAAAPVVLEADDNSTPAKAQVVTPPCEIAGNFYPQRDADWFQFEAKKGDVYTINLLAHRLGNPIDARMLIQRVTKNDKGEETVADLANVDDAGDRNARIGSDFDTSTDDPSYRLTADQDATYRVMVIDQVGGDRVDPRATYRLVITPAKPDFRVVVVDQPIVVPNSPTVVQMGAAPLRRGGTTTLAIQVDRRDGFTGEIEVTAEGLPQGVTSRGLVLGANQSTGSLILEATEDAPVETAAFRVLAKATIDGQPVVRHARPGSVLWGTANRTQDPPAFRVARELRVAVIEEPDPTWVEAGENKIWETSLGGKLEIPLKVVRRRDTALDLTLAPVGLPDEIKPKNIAVKKDVSEEKLLIEATNAKAAAGVYTFYLRADAKTKLVRDAKAVSLAEARQKMFEGKVQEADAAAKAATQQKEASTKALEEKTAATRAAEEVAKKAAEAATQAATAAKEAADKLTAAKEAAAKAAGDVALQEAAAAAEKAKTTADEAATEAQRKAKEAEQTLTDARAAQTKAEADKKDAEQAATTATAQLTKVQELKKGVDKQFEDTKKANEPKDLDYVAISTPVRFRIVPSPIKLNLGDAKPTVVAGAMAELPVPLERLYGFAEAIDLTLEVPGGVAGLAAKPVAVPGDQASGKLEITTAENTPAGEHTCTLKAKAKFNNVAVESSLPIVIKVEPKPAT